MLEEQRRQYLHAMGISIWRARDIPVTDALQPDTSINGEQQIEQTGHDETARKTRQISPTTESPDSSPATNKQPKQWLIWVDQRSSQQHPGIISDLQALCQHILPNSPSPMVIHQQPDGPQDQTAILGIGLSDENQSWLSRQPNHMINIPDLAEWHNQPAVKQQVWRKLQEAPW